MEHENTYAAWVEAFSIFAKYEPAAFYQVSAEHDIIYAGPSPSKVSQEDKEKLESLKWRIDQDLESFYHHV